MLLSIRQYTYQILSESTWREHHVSSRENLAMCRLLEMWGHYCEKHKMAKNCMLEALNWGSKLRTHKSIDNWRKAWLCHMQEMRKQCEDQRIRALITRLLFILTRCSRLILSGVHTFTLWIFHFLALQLSSWASCFCHLELITFVRQAFTYRKCWSSDVV